MVRSRISIPSRAILATTGAILALVSTTSAFDLRLLAPFQDATEAFGAAQPQITNAPSADAVELRLEKRLTASVLPACADSCLASVVTKWTTCSLGDHVCECQYGNALIIEEHAAYCIESACGYAVAVAVSSTAAQACASYLAEQTSGAAPASTTPQTTIVTRTAGDGSPVTLTSVINGSPTSGSGSGSGSGSSNSGGSSSQDSSSTSSSNSGSSLSTGAIAGIAVGAAGGSVIICAIIFLLYRCISRTPSNSAAPPPAPPAVAAAAFDPSPAAAGLVGGGKSELETKIAVVPISTPSPAPTSTLSGVPVSPNSVSRNPSLVSAQTVPQPGYPGGAPPQWGYSAGQGGYVFAPAGQPIPGVVYQEAPAVAPRVPEMPGGPGAEARQELSATRLEGGMYEMPGGANGTGRP